MDLNCTFIWHVVVMSKFIKSGMIGWLVDNESVKKVKRSKAVAVTDLEGPYDCETSRLLHFL
jgi:hypothetical protein